MAYLSIKQSIIITYNIYYLLINKSIIEKDYFKHSLKTNRTVLLLKITKNQNLQN